MAKSLVDKIVADAWQQTNPFALAVKRRAIADQRRNAENNEWHASYLERQAQLKREAQG